MILEVLMVRHEPALMRFFGVLLFLLGIHGPPVAWAGEVPFFFENAELKTVIEKASELTGLAFLYDPKQVKGMISLHAPGKVSPEEALELLESALRYMAMRFFRRGTPSGLCPQSRPPPGDPLTSKWCPWITLRRRRWRIRLPASRLKASGLSRIIPPTASSSMAIPRR
jgi:hypothetical protein